MTHTRRYDAHKDLTPEDRETVRELIRSLGHAGELISVVFAITRDEIGVRIHLTEYLRDETGMRYLDVAADHPASRPHVHDVAPEQLPASLRSAEETF